MGILQKPISYNNGKGWDGVFYAKMTEDFQAGQKPNTEQPFVYRVGLPFLASLFSGNQLRSYIILGIVANFLSFMLFWIWIRMYVDSAWMRFMAILLFICPFHSMTRRVWFVPIHTDYWDKVFLILGLILIKKAQEKQDRLKEIIILSIVTFIGVFFREIVIVVACAFLFIKNPPSVDKEKPRRIKVILPRFRIFIPLIFGILGLLLTRILVEPQGSAFFTKTAFRWLSRKSPLDYIYAWFIAFGPIVVLPLYDWKNMKGFLMENQPLLIYLMGFAILGWIGGAATYRLLHWATPVVLLLFCISFRNHRELILRNWAFMTILIASLVISQRFFWLWPDYPGGNSHFIMLFTPLSTNPPILDIIGLGSRRVRAIGFVQYILLSVILIATLKSPVFRIKKNETA